MTSEQNKIEVGTIVRTALLGLALINQLLVYSGHSVLPITDQTLELVITNGFTLVASLMAWWKNNSFTKKAIAADQVLKESK